MHCFEWNVSFSFNPVHGEQAGKSFFVYLETFGLLFMFHYI